MISKSHMTKHDITMVAAVAANNVIGNDNKLMWDYPNDMKRFVRLTKGSIIVMGRKTHESIGAVLPDRINIIVTHKSGYKTPFVSESSCRNMSVNAVLELSKRKSVFIIGGGQIYREFLPYAHTLEITQILAPFAGDTYFPETCDMEWTNTRNERFEPDGNHQFPYEFNTYKRH